MGITFLHCITDTEQVLELVFNVRNEPVKHRHTNSQSSKLMSMYNICTVKMVFIFIRCTHTLFAVASLYKATFFKQNHSSSKENKKLFEGCERYCMLSDACSYSNSQYN
jgi:hypothetical protein